MILIVSATKDGIRTELWRSKPITYVGAPVTFVLEGVADDLHIQGWKTGMKWKDFKFLSFDAMLTGTQITVISRNPPNVSHTLAAIPTNGNGLRLLFGRGGPLYPSMTLDELCDPVVQLIQKSVKVEWDTTTKIEFEIQ